MKKIFLLILFLINYNFALSQSDTLILHKTIYFENEIILSDIDTYGRIYICDKKGVIKRLDSLGNMELLFSPPSSIVPTNFTAQNPNQVFVFYQELQEWVVLNRFLTEIEHYKISKKIETNNNYGEIGFVRLLAPSPTNTLWFFDESDFSLKNYDVLNKQILSQTPLGLILKNEDYPIFHLQFYQGQIFLGVKGQGILIFDNFGNYKMILKYPDWSSISFEKEFIIISSINKDKNKIIRKGLYDKNITELILLNQNIENTKHTTNHFFQFNSTYYQIIKSAMYIYTSK